MAEWSPDGAHIATISDADGEDEIWILDHLGAEPARQLTDGHSARFFGLAWSPDGDRIAFSDYLGRLMVVTVADGSEVLVADDIIGAIGDYEWSPDGGHLAFSLNNPAGISRVFIWSVGSDELQQATSDLFSSYSPSWSPDGDYLFYISERSYAPQISTIEWNFATDRETYVYALALRGDVEHPFPVESDEVTLEVVEGRDRLPESTKLGYCGLDLSVTPLAFSPVGLVHPADGRHRDQP